VSSGSLRTFRAHGSGSFGASRSPCRARARARGGGASRGGRDGGLACRGRLSLVDDAPVLGSLAYDVNRLRQEAARAPGTVGLGSWAPPRPVAAELGEAGGTEGLLGPSDRRPGDPQRGRGMIRR
jgi:hypothetical protein